MGCLITVFSFYGFRDEVEALVTGMSRAGRPFFDKHLDNRATAT